MMRPIAQSACFGAAALLAAALLMAPALADGMPRAAESPRRRLRRAARRCTLSANVAIASDYVFRGFSQTAEGLAIQGGFDATCGSFYIGVWASNLDLAGAAVRP